MTMAVQRHNTPTEEDAIGAAAVLGLKEPTIVAVLPGGVDRYGAAKVVYRDEVGWNIHTLVVPDEEGRKPYLIWGHYGYVSRQDALGDARAQLIGGSS